MCGQAYIYIGQKGKYEIGVGLRLETYIYEAFTLMKTQHNTIMMTSKVNVMYTNLHV